ncbi:MAG: hypothetical protein R3D88_02835 [Alphaproteobacteria bacterium]
MIDTPVGSMVFAERIAGNINPGGQSEVTVVEGAIVVKWHHGKTLSEQYETVKLGGFNDNIQDVGVQPSETIGKTYGSVSDVVPKLFSSINDTAKEEVQHKDVKTETTEDNSEILEDVVEEKENSNRARATRFSNGSNHHGSLSTRYNTPILQQPLLNTLKEPTNTNSTLLQQPRDIKNFSLDTINPTIFKDLPLQLKAGGSQLFEGKMAGDVVGRFFAEGGALGPKTFTFGNGLTTSSDGQFTLVQLGNVVEIRLVSNALPLEHP